MRYNFKITDDTSQAFSTKSEEKDNRREKGLLIKLQRLPAIPHRPQTTGLAPDLRGI